MGPATIISTGLQMVGSVMGTRAEVGQAKAEQYTAEENARRAEQNAAQIRLAGQSAEEAKRRELRRSLGRSAAAMAQSGTGSGGSNALLLKQSSTEAEFDALSLRSQYANDAYGQDLEALNQKAAAQAARRRARGAKTAGWLNLAGTALSGFSRYSGNKAQMAALAPRAYSSPGPSSGVNIGIRNIGP